MVLPTTSELCDGTWSRAETFQAVSTPHDIPSHKKEATRSSSAVYINRRGHVHKTNLARAQPCKLEHASARELETSVFPGSHIVAAILAAEPGNCDTGTTQRRGDRRAPPDCFFSFLKMSTYFSISLLSSSPCENGQAGPLMQLPFAWKMHCFMDLSINGRACMSASSCEKSHATPFVQRPARKFLQGTLDFRDLKASKQLSRTPAA
mmetsp:Transcript_3360/g.11270  ORF Transcript_3360/g.11270 Transcript_3360/m.11270 type:complete len:207 (+) Transcript_3360:148-768(+)